MRSSKSATDPRAPDPLWPGPQGFAHRGLHGPGAPENSVAAFRAAIASGAGIECDVRLSADGDVMVFHDHDLNRMCGTDLNVEETAADILAGHRLLGSEENIPWLCEVLDLVDGRVPLLIELKCCRNNAGRLASAVAQDLANYAGPVGVMSFDPKVGRWFARNQPYRRRGLVVSRRSNAFDRWTAAGVARPHFLAVDRVLLETGWARRARRRYWLYSWTIGSAPERSQAAVHADALIWEADGRP